MTDEKPAVLFLCLGNSCRSQMAEAFLNKYAGDRFRVFSAGLEPADEIHPLTRRVMEEVGLDISGQYPKDLRGYLGEMAVQYGITVCERTAEKCPATWPAVTHRLLWPFEDPVEYEGTEEEKLAKFRQVRDQIRARIRAWLRELDASNLAGSVE